ncbi:hypothetical protein AMTRI_Chr08g209010 [Amborella trichopoda]
MIPEATGNSSVDIPSECGDESVNLERNGDQRSLYTSTSNKGFLSKNNENPRSKKSIFITNLPTRAGFLRLSSRNLLPSPSARFRRIAEEREEISRSVLRPSTQGTKEGFNVPFIGSINWVHLKNLCKEWIKNPLNLALLVWIIAVAISGAILFLVMTGMLNRDLPKKSQRDAWFEVNNQILNALFTLMCLYQHPKRFYHLALLCRWRPDDILKLRKIYCKNGTYKPHEWTHMMIVVMLLHVNCFAQYALCGLNWGYKRSQRPPIGVGLCLAVAIAAPAFAGIYGIVSPLGKEYEPESDEEAQITAGLDTSRPSPSMLRKSMEKRYSFVKREDENRILETRPEWRGGLFEFWNDVYLAYLTVFCTFCVFGWNMERLRFGNMYVHIATFVLLCSAPFWIFNLAAININNEVVREALGFTGVVLCIFGLLYGGFWRIQMRKKFNLPDNGFCCGKPAVTDCAQWLFCCACSLAQEVRTRNYYDVEEDRLYRKREQGEGSPKLSPLPRENGSVTSYPLWNSGSSPLGHGTLTRESPTTAASDEQVTVAVDSPSSSNGGDAMEPPSPVVIERF